MSPLGNSKDKPCALQKDDSNVINLIKAFPPDELKKILLESNSDKKELYLPPYSI